MNTTPQSIVSESAVNTTEQSPRIGVSVVIPCFNEADAIPVLADRLRQVEVNSGDTIHWQWILVDDGSVDQTSEVIHRSFAEFDDWTLIQHASNRGLIAALRTGFAAAECGWVASLDADGTYAPELLLELIALAEPQGESEKESTPWDVVTLSPYHRNGRVENVVAWRIALSRAASLCYRVLFHSKLSCYTCCVRMYRTRLLRDLPDAEFRGFVGVTELLWMLDQRGARISEVPATLTPRKYGVSKMRTLRVSWGHAQLMLSIARQRIQNKGVRPLCC